MRSLFIKIQLRYLVVSFMKELRDTVAPAIVKKSYGHLHLHTTSMSFWWSRNNWAHLPNILVHTHYQYLKVLHDRLKLDSFEYHRWWGRPSWGCSYASGQRQWRWSCKWGDAWKWTWARWPNTTQRTITICLFARRIISCCQGCQDCCFSGGVYRQPSSPRKHHPCTARYTYT